VGKKKIDFAKDVPSASVECEAIGRSRCASGPDRILANRHVLESQRDEYGWSSGNN
jgi:hypothetical protein